MNEADMGSRICLQQSADLCHIQQERQRLMSQKLQSGCFYGQLSKTERVPDLTLTEIAYPSRHVTPEHSHEQAYFSFTLNGRYTKMYGSQRVECTPQTLVFHPPSQKQSGKCGEAGGRSFLIELETSFLHQLQRHPLIADRLSIYRDGPLLRFAARLYQEFRRMDELSPLTIEGLMLEMLAEASRKKANSRNAKPPRWLEQTREIASTSFSEHLTIGTIAKSVGVHPVYLATQFRRTYGSTLGEYIRKFRVEFACRALSTTDTPMIQIALDCGFSNQSHFCTSFRRVTGMTPTAYRELFRPS